ncbi:MAG: hypothetical protein K5931_05945 [Lachnospiraceae bacterium]|nr:hypothetical protein [Lachnospiraceae bacterium]
MKNKISNIVFIVIFMAVLILPALFINRKSNQISEIDNQLLVEWPGIDLRLSTIADIEKYVDGRIGFREEMISSYISLNDKLFHVMVHPLFMYGKEGHIFFKDPYYIRAYQRLNTDEVWLDSFTGFLEKTKDYLEKKDIKFIYYLCPDKKTVYSEYFPDTIHVKEDNPSVIEYLRKDLEKTDIEYIIPLEELTEAKKTQVVYNKLYDATHWNEDGAFIGHELIDKKLQEYFDDVEELKKDDFERTMETQTSLDISRFPINEQVPLYTLKEEKGQNFTDLLLMDLKFDSPTFYSHFNNPECQNDRKLLVFTDSYFKGYYKFYENRFKDVYFVHRQNYRYLQYYVNLFFPDMVIFETAERSITGEMMEAIESFDDYYYEPGFDKEKEKEAYSEGDAPSYELTELKGVTLAEDNKTLLLNVEGGASIVSIEGYIRDTEGFARDYDVYAKIGDSELVECNYYALNPLGELSVNNNFSINIQRRYLFEEDIDLIALNRNTGEKFLLNRFEVRYEN